MFSIFLQAEVPEGTELFSAMLEAFKNGHYSIAVSLVLMILVWAATKAPVLKDVIKGEAKIWVSAVAGVIGAFATALFLDAQDGAIDWFAVILEGLSTGLAAGGLWSLLGKRLLGGKEEASE